MNNFTILLILLFSLYIISSFFSLKNRQRIILFLSFILLYFFHAFRDPITVADGLTYYRAFTDFGKVSIVKAMQIAPDLVGKSDYSYAILNNILYKIIPHRAFFYIVVSFIVLIGPFYAIRKYSPYVFLSVLIYFLRDYADSLGIIRNHLTYAILFFSYPYIIKRDLIKFLILFVIAFFMHKSSIIMLPVYFLYGFNDLKKLLRVYLICAALLLSAFPLLSGAIDYFGWGTYLESEIEPTSGVLIIFIVHISLAIIFMRKHLFDAGIKRLLFCLSLLGLLICINSFFLPGLWYRMMRYFSISLCIYLPVILSYIHNRMLRKIITASIIVAYIYLFYININGFSENYEFKFIWDSNNIRYFL